MTWRPELRGGGCLAPGSMFVSSFFGIPYFGFPSHFPFSNLQTMETTSRLQLLKGKPSDPGYFRPYFRFWNNCRVCRLFTTGILILAMWVYLFVEGPLWARKRQARNRQFWSFRLKTSSCVPFGSSLSITCWGNQFICR